MRTQGKGEMGIVFFLEGSITMPLSLIVALALFLSLPLTPPTHTHTHKTPCHIFFVLISHTHTI